MYICIRCWNVPRLFLDSKTKRYQVPNKLFLLRETVLQSSADSVFFPLSKHSIHPKHLAMHSSFWHPCPTSLFHRILLSELVAFQSVPCSAPLSAITGCWAKSRVRSDVMPVKMSPVGFLSEMRLVFQLWSRHNHGGVTHGHSSGTFKILRILQGS